MKTIGRYLVLLAILAGCANTSPSTGRQSIEEGCVSASAAIRVLTVANQTGKLSASQQQSISNAIAITDPICRGSAVPDNSSAFRAAIHALEVAATGVNHAP
jgi:hypothetical protein